MNYTQLSKAVAEKLGATHTEGAKAVNAVFDAITAAIAAGEKVTMVGFGTFEKVERAARTARNPRTGEAVEVPATSVPKFKAAPSLKTTINN